MCSRNLVDYLNHCHEHPWFELANGKPITDRWLSRQLRPYGIRPKTVWINDQAAKGYLKEDFSDVFHRYISKSDYEALRAEWGRPPGSDSAKNGGNASNEPKQGNLPPS